MIRPIILYGDPALELESTEVRGESIVEVRSLVSDMFETMHKANGIGLAAIQIGIPLRIFIIEAHLPEENFHFREVFINPHIINEDGPLVRHPEGCLSVPQLTAIVERPENIEIEWLDDKWEYRKEKFSGIAARIIQHEYDHLDGNLYIDRLDKMWREMMDVPLDLIKERKMSISYQWKNSKDLNLPRFPSWKEWKKSSMRVKKL
jgi:peptide deformylase